MEKKHIWIISTKGDKLSEVTSKKLKDKKIPVLFSNPSDIAKLDIALVEQKLYINRKLIGGILFRAKPDSFFSESFVEQDRQFCDSEVAALILAAMNLPSILSINKYDAHIWFDKSSWSGWRYRCIQRNIKVAAFNFGNVNLNGTSVWLPYNSFIFRVKPHVEVRKLLGAALTESTPCNKYFIIGRKTFCSNNSFVFEDQVKLLQESGIYISEIISDPDGNLLTVNTLPHITDKDLLEEASNLLVKEYNDFMSRR